MGAVKFGKSYIYGLGPVGGLMTEYRVRPAKQCTSKCFMTRTQCQGASGHDGLCWCYSPDGWLHRWVRKGHKLTGMLAKQWKGIASSQTPPDHAGYVHPKEMFKLRHSAFNETKKVREYQDDESPFLERP